MKWPLLILSLALPLALLRPSSGQAMGGIIQAPYYILPAQKYRYHPPRLGRHTHHKDDAATPPQGDGDQDHSRTSTK
jgi:hypothetical protein